eukprot:CAMPEP_0172312886 /NCGR_PEP_ID=MMETSP1058-20130122/18730_1 /TAXON_ID=83371 /ORGANISM="Detonula confervacea, Strain CCMP 353" /LENGTH=55 /DNA_ID=CAMNT_0013026441 /DNA_START=71 /DNA_END=238 /DNA_ORIENTATION=+
MTLSDSDDEVGALIWNSSCTGKKYESSRGGEEVFSFSPTQVSSLGTDSKHSCKES